MLISAPLQTSYVAVSWPALIQRSPPGVEGILDLVQCCAITPLRVAGPKPGFEVFAAL